MRLTITEFTVGCQDRVEEIASVNLSTPTGPSIGRQVRSLESSRSILPSNSRSGWSTRYATPKLYAIPVIEAPPEYANLMARTAY